MLNFLILFLKIQLSSKNDELFWLDNNYTEIKIFGMFGMRSFHGQIWF
jgi:hypothetical protein